MLRFSAGPYDDIVEAECRLWEGTRYALNRRRRGVSVDCIHFVSGVLDALFKSEPRESLHSLLPDACVHDRGAVLAVTRMWLRVYPHDRVRGDVVEAGDVIVYKPDVERSTASHVGIVGADGKLWHATHPVVCYTGLGNLQGLAHLATYRSPCKSLWSS